MKIGILTGGGDCPGLNAVIRAAVRKGSFHYDDKFVGFMEGWRGLLEDKSMATLKKHGADALIAIGGDDTLSVATKLFDHGVRVVGVPKTIDNDLEGTDFTFGFDTAVNVVTE